MSLLNGVRVTEAIELKTTLDTNNPIIGPDEMQLSYDSIDGITGAYLGVRARVGPGRWTELTDIFNNAGSFKLFKPFTMTVDNEYLYTFTSGDIAALGNAIAVAQVIINNQAFPATVTYSNYPVAAGNTALISGLPEISFVSSSSLILI